MQIHWSRAEHLQSMEELDAGIKRLDVPFPIWYPRHLLCKLGRHTFQGTYYPYCNRCGISEAKVSKSSFIEDVILTTINFGFFVWGHWWYSIAAALLTLLLAWSDRPLRFRFDRR